MDLSIDRQPVSLTCPACDAEFLVVRGSVFDAGQPVGLYLIALHGHSPGGPVAHLAVALRNPEDEDAVPVAVAMDVVPASGEFGFYLVDWRDSTWQTESYLGDRIDRAEALEHPRSEDFLRVAGTIAKSLEEVGEYLFGR